MIVDPEPKRKYFVEIGFVFSLVVLLILLKLMGYFSAHNLFLLDKVVMYAPINMGKAEHIFQITMPQTQSAPPANIAPPKSQIPVIVPDNVIISADNTMNTQADPKTDALVNPISGNGSGTHAEAVLEEPMNYMNVEENPIFPEGIDALLIYVRNNIKYPIAAKNANISGTVTVSFIVEKDGSVSTVKVVSGIGGGCNKEAVRVVSTMPKWIPGKQEGKPVRVQCQIPIIFFLQAQKLPR